MAQTIYAGGGGWNIGLQGASDTLAGAQRLENDQKLTDAQVRRMEAMGEAEELENQIRQQTIEQMRDASRVESFLMRKSLQPDEFAQQAEEAPESIAQAMGGATREQVEQMQGLLAQGQYIAAQTQFAQQLGQDLGMAGMLADAESSPMLVEGIADLQQRLAAYDPMNPEAESPQELAQEFREIKQQDYIFRAARRDRERAAAAFDEQFGQGEEYAAIREMYLDQDMRDEALEMALDVKYPKATSTIRQKAQAEVLDEKREFLADQLLKKLLGDPDGIEPGGEEWNRQVEGFWKGARKLYGEEVVPLSEQEQQVQQVRETATALSAVGATAAEIKAALKAGPEAVERLYAEKARGGAKARSMSTEALGKARGK